MMTNQAIRKKEGFQGQKAIVIPRKILANQCDKNKVIGSMYITDIGYYPKAKFHYRERRNGADQHILIYCIDGKGWVKINEVEYSIQAGHFFIVPIHEPHTYAADETEPWTIYWVHFKGNTSDATIGLIQKKWESIKGFIHYHEGRINLFS